MIRIIKPTYQFKHVYDIEPDFLIGLAKKLIVLDMDNTIIRKNETNIDQAILDWIKSLKEQGFKIILCTNNHSQRHINVSQLIACEIVQSALKPFSWRLMKHLKGYSNESILWIGDQLFTDVLGSNMHHIDSVLVKPLSIHEHGLTKMVRHLERLVLKGNKDE